MLICFAPMFTRGMKKSDVNYILKKSVTGMLKTSPRKLPLNKQGTKMPSRTHLGHDSQLPLAGSSRRQSVLLGSPVAPKESAARSSHPACHNTLPRPRQAFASREPCLAPGASWRAGTGPSLCPGSCPLDIPRSLPQQLPTAQLKTLLLFPVC